MPGFWKRPTARTYSYNLDLGEHYYSPMTSYLDSERGTRGETPGALTFSERLARKWVTGRRYESTELRDRYSRSSSMTKDASRVIAAAEMPESAQAARALRAASEMRTASTHGSRASTSAWADRHELSRQAQSGQQFHQHQEQSSQRQAAQQHQQVTVQRTTQVQEQQKQVKESKAVSEARMRIQQQHQRQQLLQMQGRAQSVQRQEESRRESRQHAGMQKTALSSMRDDIIKRVADLHMNPLQTSQEIQEAEDASARAKARIFALERDLEEITKRAIMTTSQASMTAKQMAMKASMEADEEARQATSKKTRKVIVESGSKIAA